MKLGLIKALFSDELKKQYDQKEIESIFYVALDFLEKKSKTHVLLGDDTLMQESYMNILSELLTGKPIQQVIGVAPFYTMELSITKDVLIPRPETEELVHWIIEENQGKEVTILDIGTGSGCIALALAKHLPKAKVSGLDVSEKAIEVAKQNANNLELNVRFHQLDILKNTIPDSYDILVSNPPYISQKERTEMEENVTKFEPEIALFVDDENPLLFYKEIIAKNGGANKVYFEISEFQSLHLVNYLESTGYAFEFRKDMNGKDRMLRVDLRP